MRTPTAPQLTEEALKTFRPRVKALGLTLTIQGTRSKWWELRSKNYMITATFDSDIHRALTQVESGIAFDQVRLFG